METILVVFIVANVAFIIRGFCESPWHSNDPSDGTDAHFS